MGLCVEMMCLPSRALQVLACWINSLKEKNPTASQSQLFYVFFPKQASDKNHRKTFQIR